VAPKDEEGSKDVDNDDERDDDETGELVAPSTSSSQQQRRASLTMGYGRDRARTRGVSEVNNCLLLPVMWRVGG
jgi:hypothetical protein